MYLCIYVSMYLCIYVSMYLCIHYQCIYISFNSNGIPVPLRSERFSVKAEGGAYKSVTIGQYNDYPAHVEADVLKLTGTVPDGGVKAVEPT
jgi:hypothetical protein